MKQIQHILTGLLYMPLHDPAWQMTSTRIENNCRVVATIELKRIYRLSRISPKVISARVPQGILWCVP